MTTTSSPLLPFFKDPDRFNWILGTGLLILYGPLLVYWYNGWINHNISLEHEYFSHGVLGLPLAAKTVWDQRQQWQDLNDRWHPAGAALMGLAAALYLSGISDTVNLSFPLLLAGLCLWLKGTEGLKLQTFPLLLLFFATPTDAPYLVAPYTLGLQTFIAGAAGFILQQLHFDVVVQEIYLYVGGRIVEVAPHCAGLKALFSNLYFCMIGVYWIEAWKNLNKVLTLILGSVVISVVVNILRNTLLTIFHGTGQDGLFHWFHEGWGSELYWVALIGLLFVFFKAVDRFWAAECQE
jgi:cyanoexosortase B